MARPQPIELSTDEREPADRTAQDRADRVSLQELSPRAYRRHEIIAALDAIGWPARRIARFLGITPVVVSQLRREPAYAAACDALAARAQRAIVEGTFDVAKTLAADARENWTFLKAVRDSEAEKTEHRLKVALELFDRQAPKPRQAEREEPLVRINFDMRDVVEMKEALAAAGARAPGAPAPLAPAIETEAQTEAVAQRTPDAPSERQS